MAQNLNRSIESIQISGCHTSHNREGGLPVAKRREMHHSKRKPLSTLQGLPVFRAAILNAEKTLEKLGEL